MQQLRQQSKLEQYISHEFKKECVEAGKKDFPFYLLFAIILKALRIFA